jgi:acyl-CoA synthetase (AMP-forming)/AMP-acid ligase II
MPPSPAANANIARFLTQMAERQPEQAALKIPRGRTRAGDIDYLSLNFRELAHEVAAWRRHLLKRGVKRGDRTLVMVKPGLPLIAAAFALFQLGAVPVIIDPGMGLKNFLSCVERTQPRVLLGIPAAQIASRIFRRTFRPVEVRIGASSSLTARLARGESQISDFKFQNRGNPSERHVSLSDSEISNLKSEIVASAAGDLAAILFTSGSTGAPKGVCYEHGMFEAQVNLIRDTYGITPGEIDLPMLPIFALFNPALGMTTVVPEIDARRPASVDPCKIVQAIQQENVTNSFGSPTLWKKIGDHCRERKIALPTLRRVLCAGAPVPAALWTQSSEWLTQGRLQSPYGATEALPVSSIASDEVDVASVRGACVGHPLAGITAKIIAITDAPIATLADARELPAGEIGEIIVSGPVVTKTYDALPEATAAAKIFPTNETALSAKNPSIDHSSLDIRHSAAPGGGVWHRMGDCGYLDDQNRLWFCGRKAERVETAARTYFTEPCEQVFRAHPAVKRCALIGVETGNLRQPALVIEGVPDAKLATVLSGLARQHPHTEGIDTFYFHPAFPVDVRHNAKIHRLTLARWAIHATPYRATSLSPS